MHSAVALAMWRLFSSERGNAEREDDAAAGSARENPPAVEDVQAPSAHVGFKQLLR